MVDVSAKAETVREAIARATLAMAPKTLRAIKRGDAPKGDVLGTARTAGILAAKRTPELIPLCHPLRLTGIDVLFSNDAGRSRLTIEARVRTVDKTGVEMEALTAASVAALTVYDMVKAIEKGVTIERVELVEKSGGKSGHWRAQPRPSRTGHPRSKSGTRTPLQ
jgi:cyclic pyranopterin monophosphate synthase